MDRFRRWLPLFAAAGLTHQSRDAFFVGLAASVGAGISMGLAEALSDDGSVTGRGSPLLRGVITGVATTVGECFIPCHSSSPT